LAEQASQLQSQQDQFGIQVERAGAHLNNLQDQADNQATHLHNLQRETDKTREQLARQEAELENTKAQLHEIRQTLVRADERQISDGAFLKSELNLLDRRLAELSSAPARGPKRAPAALAESNHELDALYVAFEDQFRGSRELIKNRLQPYLNDVSQLNVVTKDTPLLDLGCGRGEWLELLQDHGFAAEGVDSNTVFAGLCVERGLRVNLGDAITYLRSLPAASRGAITAFHLIEHLPFPILVTLIKESLRVLQPGGLVIFETPNPDNILVGSSRFYSDPTHLHPLPKEYPAFLLRLIGFSDVTTRPLHPDNDSLPEDSASPELRNFLNRLFFGDQDYAVIGRKLAV
jgi:O-antigen chain-terminating methyltransferase